MTQMTISRSSRVAILLVGATLAPTFATAQSAPVTPRTHVVKPGETLRDIARQDLHDPKRWEEIYKLNAGAIKNPHLIFAGQKLKLPDDKASSVASAKPDAPKAKPVAATPSVTKPAKQPNTKLLEQAKAPPTPVPVQRAPSLSDPTALTAGGAGRASAATQRSQTVARVERATVRAGEFYAAPWTDRVGGPGGGRILRSGDAQPIGQTDAERNLQLSERVLVTPPPGRAVAVGDRYLSYTLGPEIEGVGQVVIPTGVLRAEKTAAGQSIEARVISKFGTILPDQQLLPLDAAPSDRLARPTAVSNGAATRVLWINGEHILPTLQAYLMVQGGTNAGFKPGDQVTLLRPPARNEEGAMMPESVIAVASLVRVGANASTAIIIDHHQAAIQEGTVGRVTAKMP
jgi:LysM repeat protein